MKKGRSSTNWPLFPEASDVWERFELEVQQEAESVIASLLAIHVQKSVAEPHDIDNRKEDQS